MKPFLTFLQYEKADYELVEALSEIIGGAHPQKHLRRLFEPYLHPRGIKELAARKEIRLVYAMLKLLDSAAPGAAAVDDRISALKSLRDEVVEGNASSLKMNTARVLLQIMKMLIRSNGDHPRQLRLAHELRIALIGQPRFIRRQLQRYHLLEMPEAWNQTTFDDHVHDANTKGRKTPTHLIMDAWIKGIRQLQVIYYSYVPPLAARELLQAAEIMGIDIRIGVEYSTAGRGKFVDMIWTPRGFSSTGNFLAFLEKPEVKAFFAGAAAASEWRTRQVMAQFKHFNAAARLEMNDCFHVACPELSEDDFLKSVGAGQPSMLHLSEFIYGVYAPLLRRRLEDFDLLNSSAEELAQIKAQSALLSPEFVNDQYLAGGTCGAMPENISELPPVMRLPQRELSEQLYALPSACRLCLNLSGLTLEDVIEVIYDCAGRVTHLEIFNLKDFKSGNCPDIAAINALRQAINHGNVVRLKHIIRETIERVGHSGDPHREARLEKLHLILRNIPALIEFYAGAPLGTRLGSDSTGRYRRLHGMGMIITDSLPWRERRRILSGRDRNREVIPVEARVTRCSKYTKYASGCKWFNVLNSLFRRFNYPFGLGLSRKDEWQFEDSAAQIGQQSNIASLGGYWDEPAHEGVSLFHPYSFVDYWNCLNSNLRIAIKVLTGFIPAFLSFYFTNDWWLLAYGGAFIWLGITGVRNIIQAVLGGGGCRRSDLLKWNDFISWQRIADSLMYTGISVPLLDLCVKTLLLNKGMGLTADKNPIAVYSVIALVNGCYISGHNLFRGLPRTAVIGNLFRAGPAILLSILFSTALAAFLGVCGVANAAGIIQQWAAVISKAASDCVAAVIEGYADRMKNIRLRLSDYRGKLAQLFGTYARLEVLFPEDDVLEMLKSPKTLVKSIDNQDLERIMIVNALDLLYFWMYQPQAGNALSIIIHEMSQEERRILIRSQFILKREKDISQMLVDGVIGKNFAGALSFYLDRHPAYLRQIKKKWDA
ncbi:MAG: hypothetical protein WCV67_14345 [Victivallaceae bacterium]